MHKIRAILARPVPRKEQTVGSVGLAILIRSVLGVAQDGARYRRDIQPLVDRIDALEKAAAARK